MAAKQKAIAVEHTTKEAIISKPQEVSHNGQNHRLTIEKSIVGKA